MASLPQDEPFNPMLDTLTNAADVARHINLGGELETKIRDKDYRCLHRQTVLDTEARTVTCRACRKSLDPFDLLLSLAREERWFDMWEREGKKLRARLAELRKEEQRVKARVKNASRKDADAAVAAEREKLDDERRRLTYKAREIEQLAAQMRRILKDRALRPSGTEAP